jgi:hypothetical protein
VKFLEVGCIGRGKDLGNEKLGSDAASEGSAVAHFEGALAFLIRNSASILRDSL